MIELKWLRYSDDNMYLKVDSLMKIINIITGSNNITFRKLNVKPNRFDELYMQNDLKEDKLDQKLYQFNERKIINVKFYSILLSKIYPFYDVDGWACKILFVNGDKTKKLVDGTND